MCLDVLLVCATGQLKPGVNLLLSPNVIYDNFFKKTTSLVCLFLTSKVARNTQLSRSQQSIDELLF